MTRTEDTLMRAGAKLAGRAQRQKPEARHAMEGVAIILFAAMEDGSTHAQVVPEGQEEHIEEAPLIAA